MKLDEQSKLEKRIAILEAAERCFAQKGFHQTSMQDIHREAEMSAGNLYRYFDSKEAIIEAFAAQELSWLTQAIEDVPSSDNMRLAIFDTFFWTMTTMLDDGRAALTAELFAESGRNPKINAIYTAFNSRLADEIGAVLEMAQANGIVAPHHDLASIAQIFIVLVDGMAMQKIVNPELDVMKQRPLLETMLKCLLGTESAAK